MYFHFVPNSDVYQVMTPMSVNPYFNSSITALMYTYVYFELRRHQGSKGVKFNGNGPSKDLDKSMINT